MPAYSMARPRSATPTGATTRPIQKLPRTLTAVAIPLRIWPASRLKAEGSEASDVLAGRVFLGQRRIPGGNDVREVELVLHRRLRLAAQEEIGTQRLVRGAVDPHRPDDVVHLQPFERLDRRLHVVGLRLVEAGEQHPRH